MTIELFLLNEVMMFLTVLICFPGFLPPEDGMEWFMALLLALPMSFAWWIFLAVSPVTFTILYFFGELSWDSWADEWPLNLAEK